MVPCCVGEETGVAEELAVSASLGRGARTGSTETECAPAQAPPTSTYSQALQNEDLGGRDSAGKPGGHRPTGGSWPISLSLQRGAASSPRDHNAPSRLRPGSVLLTPPVRAARRCIRGAGTQNKVLSAHRQDRRPRRAPLGNCP